MARLAVRLDAVPGGAALRLVHGRDHCRIAYLRGRFLARGSLSLASGRTHLEFVVDRPSSRRSSPRSSPRSGCRRRGALRRGRGVVTWKSTDTVLAFLRRIGGSSAALELESRLVTRSLRGHLNRVLNAEGANLSRSVATASRQLSAIDRLEASGELARLPAALAPGSPGLRREAPEAT